MNVISFFLDYVKADVARRKKYLLRQAFFCLLAGIFLLFSILFFLMALTFWLADTFGVLYTLLSLAAVFFISAVLLFVLVGVFRAKKNKSPIATDVKNNTTWEIYTLIEDIVKKIKKEPSALPIAIILFFVIIKNIGNKKNN